MMARMVGRHAVMQQRCAVAAIRQLRRAGQERAFGKWQPAPGVGNGETVTTGRIVPKRTYVFLDWPEIKRWQA